MRLACQDPSTSLLLCESLVCSARYDWILPTIYHSLSFNTSAQLISFIAYHNVSSPHVRSRLSSVRSVYIGPTNLEKSDLYYDSPSWPINAIVSLFQLCPKLMHLTIINLDQDAWKRLQQHVPPRVERLTMGPIHGYFDPKNLKNKPPISTFTSVLTPMSDEEVQGAVLYPSMRKLRKLSQANSMGPLWAINQVPCIAKAKHLEEYEIVICGPMAYSGPAMALLQRNLMEIVPTEPRVKVRQDLDGSWLALVYREFIEYRQDFIDVHR